ncbi:MAG: hypothetical protein QOD36_2189 [Mycobacterium sp.]|jgi:hypothetical protein|nr:hypothetical protein [Mycobacterium sp.]
MNPTIARLKTAAKLRFPRLYEALKAQRPATRKRKKSLNARSAEDIFSEIYDTNGWRSRESKSGGGSTLAATAELRAELPQLLSDLDVGVIIDAPCGDFNWMRHVDLPVQQYIGGEIVPGLIDRLTHEYATDHRRFMLLDVAQDPLPPADALFCRDLFLHLSFADIERVRRNFIRSDCKYLITSTYPNIKVNFDILTGEVRPMNLLLPPYNWPEPFRLINDNADELMDRQMGVWRRDQF